MFQFFGKSPARPLGIITSPDEAAAKTRAIEHFLHRTSTAIHGRGDQARQDKSEVRLGQLGPKSDQLVAGQTTAADEQDMAEIAVSFVDF